MKGDLKEPALGDMVGYNPISAKCYSLALPLVIL